MKVIVIGNSGSGKTWLATRLASLNHAALIHLDKFFWEPGGFDRKRDKEEVHALIEESKSAPSWIVEGVFGELALAYFSDADLLIWLDMDWATCQSRLARRGSESKAHMDRTQSEAGLAKLIEWASYYYSRTGKQSRQGHAELFDRFQGVRIQLRDEAATNAFIETKLSADEG